MIRKKIDQHLHRLLPAYINGTLNPVQHRLVALWLQRDETARKTAENLKTLQSAVRRQPQPAPPAAVFGRIQAQIQSQHHTAAQPIPQTTPPQRAALSYPVLLLSLLTLILAATVMWQALPPGIILQWSVEGQTPEAFRVYRAEVNGRTAAQSQFELLEELPAAEPGQKYTFTDFRLLPGQNYIYRVEGLDASGRPAASQTISGRGIDALPGQVAVLLMLIFAGVTVSQLLHIIKQPVTPISI